MVPFNSIDALFTALCDERSGDVVTALAHGLQCAWLLREARPGDAMSHHDSPTKVYAVPRAFQLTWS